MPIIPWRPFWDLERWFEEEFPESFGWSDFPKIRTPRMNISETEEKVIAEVELPGVDPKDIEVEVKDNYLRIEAKKKEEREEKRKGYFKREISTGYFKRVVPLPVEVEEKKAEAEYEDGILRIEIPKKVPKKEEKKVKIRIKKKE